jgi:ribosomal protein S18 acetylase RimI-like enzyme
MTTPFRIRAAEPQDVPALMRLKRLLAEYEGAAHAVRASEADWLRDGFGDKPGFTAFVAEVCSDAAGGVTGNAVVGNAVVGNAVVGMATCSRRVITGWNGPIVFLQDLYVEAEYRELGIARALAAQVAALACALGSPIVELTVHAENPAQNFYERNGFTRLPQCVTYVLAGSALAALAERGEATRTPPVAA